ncbi:glycosyltransferase family 4 protein [Ilyomonas limi]|uniref:Glycosyltransferase family 4 protein n=1 Tax=Ilyomonas limi TaxID=2575867 RepID=A0A4U3L5F3_9BACT|nr:glycosyltransferase family 4 protein [Ilyomonas limi]TKK68926.1 glycosyltransferase family 4 protein [Ilyomonas limi]
MHNKTINILGIAPYTFLPAYTGGHKNIDLFYKYLGTEENIIVASTRNNDEQSAKDYKLLKVFNNSKLRYINPFYFFILRRIVVTHKISHVIVEHPYMGWLGILLKKFTNIQLIIHSHNIEGLRFKSAGKWWWRLLLQYEGYVHRQANISFFITNEDKQYAETHFHLQPQKSFTITYGIEIPSAPSLTARKRARQTINALHHIAANEIIILFNGALNYKPNLNAVKAILTYINPQLEKANNFIYKVIICGKDLPAHYGDLIAWKDRNIIFAGFVSDISLYFLAADIFINPVIEGGGIKTKLVEALAYGNSVVSTVSGAVGIPPDCAVNKMKIVENYDWVEFARAIVQVDTDVPTSELFFEHFYWGNIAKRAAKAIESLI